jgi:hybrid cluster-associated redox disulfide protein
MPDRPITKDMPIGDVVKEHPETIPVFFKYGLHCIGCHVAAWESIAEGAAVHGVLEIDEMVDELNRAVADGPKGAQEAGKPDAKTTG